MIAQQSTVLACTPRVSRHVLLAVMLVLIAAFVAPGVRPPIRPGVAHGVRLAEPARHGVCAVLQHVRVRAPLHGARTRNIGPTESRRRQARGGSR